MDPGAGPEGIPEQVQVPLVWVAAEDQVIQCGNQFLVQFDTETFFLFVGQVSPPALLGTVEERYEQAKDLAFVPVKTLGRYSMTRRNVEQLIDLLSQMRANFDEQARGGEPLESDEE